MIWDSYTKCHGKHSIHGNSLFSYFHRAILVAQKQFWYPCSWFCKLCCVKDGWNLLKFRFLDTLTCFIWKWAKTLLHINDNKIASLSNQKPYNSLILLACKSLLQLETYPSIVQCMLFPIVLMILLKNLRLSIFSFLDNPLLDMMLIYLLESAPFLKTDLAMRCFRDEFTDACNFVRAQTLINIRQQIVAYHRNLLCFWRYSRSSSSINCLTGCLGFCSVARNLQLVSKS